MRQITEEQIKTQLKAHAINIEYGNPALADFEYVRTQIDRDYPNGGALYKLSKLRLTMAQAYFDDQLVSGETNMIFPLTRSEVKAVFEDLAKQLREFKRVYMILPAQ